MHLYSVARAINVTIVFGSAGLTGVYGWTLGENVLALCVVFFCIFAALSLLVWVLGEVLGESLRLGRTKAVLAVAPFLLAFGVYDVVTNYGTMSLFRASEINTADVRNTLASNAKTRVENLQKRIDDIRAETAWQTTYLAPEAYDALIASAQLARDNEANRGGCGRICEEKTQELATLQANKANAEKRLAMKAEMDQLLIELKEAKLEVAETPTTVSAALTHASNFQSWVTGKMAADDATLFWSNNGITLAGSIATSIAAVVTSMLMGWLPKPARHLRHAEAPPAPVSRNPYLAHYQDADEPTQPSRRRREAERYDYHDHHTTVVVPGGVATLSAETRKSIAHLQALARSLQAQT